MKRISIFLLLFLLAVLWAQYTKIYQMSDLITSSHAWYDSLKVVPGESFYALKTTSAADTIETDWVNLYGGGGDVFVMMRRDTISQQSVGVEYWVGLYLIPGYPDGSGTEWHKLATITGNGTATAALIDSSWFSNKPTSKLKFKFIEKGATQNYLLIGFTHFKQGR